MGRSVGVAVEVAELVAVGLGVLVGDAVAVSVGVSLGRLVRVGVGLGVLAAAGSARDQSEKVDTLVMVAWLAVVLTVPPGMVRVPSYLKITKLASLAEGGMSVGSR